MKKKIIKNNLAKFYGTKDKPDETTIVIARTMPRDVHVGVQFQFEIFWPAVLMQRCYEICFRVFLL